MIVHVIRTNTYFDSFKFISVKVALSFPFLTKNVLHINFFQNQFYGDWLSKSRKIFPKLAKFNR